MLFVFRLDSVLGVTLGTGLGSAFVCNGKLVTEKEDFNVPTNGYLYPELFGSRRAEDVFNENQSSFHFFFRHTYVK